MKKKTLILTSIALIAVAAIGIVVAKGRGEKPLEVQTAAAKRQEVIEKVNATGKVQPKTQVKISADVSARIMRLGVREGDRVKKGQFLVELDREAYLAQVESAQAIVRSTEAQAIQANESMRQAEREFRRAAEIVARKLDSQARLDESEAAYKGAVARHESTLAEASRARALLKQAKDSLNKTSIFAPMAGVITDLRREQGEIAIGSQFQEDVILMLSDMSEMEVQLDVDENDIVSVALGDVAEIEVDALPGRKLAGRVYEIANSAKTASGQGQAAQAQNQAQKTEFVVKVAITDPPAQLRPGMTAAADIITNTQQAALSVPVQSVTVRTLDQLEGNDKKDTAGEGTAKPAGPTAFKADEDGFVQIVFVVEGDKAVARQVQTGIQGENLIEVTSGLKEGETIISGGYRAISRDLKNGASVKVNNDKQDKPEKS